MWADDIRLGLSAGLFSDVLAHALRILPNGPDITAPEYFIVAQGIILGALWARSLRTFRIEEKQDSGRNES